MRKSGILLLLLLLLTPFIFGQEEATLKKNFIGELQKYRNHFSVPNICEDTLMSKISRYIILNEIYEAKNEKEKVRDLLNGQQIYDYEIETHHLQLKQSDFEDFQNILKYSKKLEASLNDKNFNKIGISVIKKKRNYHLEIILTKNYIDFENVSFAIIVPPAVRSEVKIPPRVHIRGRSKLTEIYYSKVNTQNTTKVSNKQEVILNNENSFNIEFEYNNEDIEFYDASGKIIAYLSNIIK